MRDRLAAYEGNENYVFISYSHKDTQTVIPIMEKLCALGCRIWYDEGIVPGSEWPEDIAQHLNNCAMVIAFISPNSMASVNCRREINFALSKQKPFLSVVLEPTEMPLGMELQLSTQQSVLRYNYRTEEQFLEKICACPDLIRCMGPLQELPQSKPAVQKPSKPAAQPETPKTKPPKASAKPVAIIAGVLVAAVVLLAVLLLPKNSGTGAPAIRTEPAATQPAQKEEMTGDLITVSVKLPKAWKSATLRTWSIASGKEESGIVLEPGQDGWYSAAIPTDANMVTIVGGDGLLETMTNTISAKDVWIYVMADGKTCQVSYDGPFEATIAVRAEFETWTDPYCWAWNKDGDVFDRWPGEAMEAKGNGYIITLPCDVTGLKFSDQAAGIETGDIIVEAGWDIWIVEKAGRYACFYEKPTEAMLIAAFGS